MPIEEPVHRVGNPHASLRSRTAKASLEIIRVGRMQQQANFARLAGAPAFCRGLPAEIPDAHAFDAEAPDMLGIVSALRPPIQNRVRMQKNTCWRDEVVVASGLTRRHPGAAKALPVRLGSRQRDPQFLDLRTAIDDDQELRAAWRDRVLEPLRSQHRIMLDRAIARGEIPASVDREVVLDLFFGAAQHRLLLGHLPLTDDFVREVVDVILDGIQRV